MNCLPIRLILFFIFISYIHSQDIETIILNPSELASAPELGYIRNIYNGSTYNFDVSDFDGDGNFEVVYYNGTSQKYINIRTIKNMVISEIPVT